MTIPPLIMQAIKGYIWRRTVEKSQTNATNATMPLLRHAIWGDIWTRTVEKNQTNAISVTMSLLMQAIWWDTWKKNKVEKSQTSVTSMSHWVWICIPPRDFQNLHVCGKIQKCVGIANDFLNYHVCGFYHTCVFFTKYLRHVKVFAKNHTCVVKTQYVCVFPKTWWSILNGSTLKRNKNICRTTMRFANIEGVGRCKILFFWYCYCYFNFLCVGELPHMCGISHTHKKLKY